MRGQIATSLSLVGGMLVLCAPLALADSSQAQSAGDIPRATPVLAVDDVGAHGPSARNFFDIALEGKTATKGGPDDFFGVGLQLSVRSPKFGNRELRDLAAPASPYAFRARGAFFRSKSEGAQGGPLTFALQRFFPIDMVALDSLADAHVGVEAALSTPWVSGRHEVPPEPLRIVNGVDTELAQNGWSLRPASTTLRADFLACRALFVDVGAAPELFVPITGPREYDLRYHGAFGWAFGCGTCSTRCPKLTVEYFGRARLYADDAPVASWSTLGLGLQVDAGPFSFQLLAATQLGHHIFDPVLISLRVLSGFKKEAP